jgi:chemotaxis protein methyltransferase CheR
MTTNVTRFFREAHHFTYLKNHVLSNLRDAILRGDKVRIWSAGSSSGEEAYSIAATVLDAVPEAADRDLIILATDIDSEMLHRGEAGRYQARQLGDVPADVRKKWFRPTPQKGEFDFEVAPELRALVRFKELNLLHEWPMTCLFDVIFCRNVMIYFDEQTQNEAWQRFADQLRPAGILCIGHSERIATAHMPFNLVGQTIYQRRGAAL